MSVLGPILWMLAGAAIALGGLLFGLWAVFNDVKFK